MERLTFEGNFCDIAMCAEVRGGSFCEDGACSQRKVWERLKAYEDIGVTPEDMKRVVSLPLFMDVIARVNGMSAERLRELLQAEAEGRIVMLPCKVDEPIYILLGEKEKRKLKFRVVECHIDHFTIGGTLIPMITACDDENEWYELIDGTRVGCEYWLTREEAEAALEGERE